MWRQKGDSTRDFIVIVFFEDIMFYVKIKCECEFSVRRLSL